MNFGKGTSLYCARYLTPEREEELLTWCKDEVRFQIFNCTSQQRVVGGEPRLKAPNAEFYLLDSYGRRPHYKWTQLNVFDHAGDPMPPILKALCEQLNSDLGLRGADRFNHCLIICNEQSGCDKNAHCAPPHADKIQKGFFVDVSLGYPREFQLIDAKSDDVAASQKLASGSLAYITADDNGRLVQGRKRVKGEPKVQGTRYKHAVPVDTDQPLDQPRFSLVFRPITDHPTKGAKRGEHLAKVNEAKAARVRPGGDLWREYNPLCRGGTGADPVVEAKRASGGDEGVEVERAATAAADKAVAEAAARETAAAEAAQIAVQGASHAGDNVSLAHRVGLSPPVSPSRSDLPTGSAVTEARTTAEAHAARDDTKEAAGDKEGLLVGRGAARDDYGRLITGADDQCLADACSHGLEEADPAVVRAGIGADHSFKRAAAFIDEDFSEWALVKATARFMVKGGIELALLNAMSSRLVLSMSYVHAGAKRYHCAYFEPGFVWAREDLERGWLSGCGVLKDNQADVAVHLAEASDRASTEAARAFFQAPYAVALRIEAVYELVPRSAGDANKRQKVDCGIQHGALPYAQPDSMPDAVQPSPPASPTPGVCVTCGGGEDEGTLRTCDGCDRDYHCNAHCHSPPIAGPKRGDWLCEACEPSQPPLLPPSSPPTSPSL